MSAEAIAREYFARMSAGDAAVVDLFGADAELVGLGQRVRGIDAIRAFYERSIETAAPQPQVRTLLAGADVAMAELEIVLADGRVHVVDLFETAGGRIQRLTYFVADDGTAGAPPPTTSGRATRD